MSKDSFSIIALESLRSAPFQSHFPLDEKDVRFQELVDSIKAIGIKIPLLVRPLEQGNYEIVAGERRARAARLAGLKEAPVIIQALDDLQAAIVQGVENLQRQDLSEAEKSRYLAFLAVEYHLSAKQIADKVGMSYTWVVRYLPAEFKKEEKAQAGALGGQAKAEAHRESQQSATSLVARAALEKAEREAMAVKVQCSNAACLEMVPEGKVITVGNKPYCEKCAPAARVELVNREKAQKRLDEKTAKPTKPSQVESYTDKLARMHNQISKMYDVQHEKAKESSELRDLGWKSEFQKEYLVVVCKSDLTLTRTRGKVQQEIAVFWDGQDAHPEPEKDAANREWAAQQRQERLGVRMEVFARTYKAYSPALADKLWSELMEFVKELDKWDEGAAVEQEKS
jgi:ParB/RepB/Spo0J family partition protein